MDKKCLKNKSRDELLENTLEKSNDILVIDTNVLTDEHLNEKSDYNKQSFVVETPDKNNKVIKKGVTIILPISLINKFSNEIDRALLLDSQQFANWLKDIEYNGELPKITNKEDEKKFIKKYYYNI